jgi:hypothetical protein
MATYEPKQLAALLLILALTACGGGGGDGDGDNSGGDLSFQVSGLVTAAGVPVADVQVSVAVQKDCFGTNIPTAFNWFGAGTSNASGEYVAIVRLDRLSQCTLNFPFRMNAFAFSCGANRQVPCYSGGGQQFWEQGDLSPKGGVNFVVTRKARIFGTIQFPKGTSPQIPPSMLRAILIPDTTGGQGGPVDQEGQFSWGPLEPGNYTVSFPPDKCSALFVTGCNGSYDFTPPSITVDIVAPVDVDTLFLAIPK